MEYPARVPMTISLLPGDALEPERLLDGVEWNEFPTREVNRA